MSWKVYSAWWSSDPPPSWWPKGGKAVVRHGDLSEGFGSLDAYMLFDQLAKCKCGHHQQEHGDDGRCSDCDCTDFNYERTPR